MAVTSTAQVDRYDQTLKKLLQAIEQPDVWDESVAFLEWILDCIKGREVDELLRNDIEGFRHNIVWSTQLERFVVDSFGVSTYYPQARIALTNACEKRPTKYAKLLLEAHETGKDVSAEWRELLSKNMRRSINSAFKTHARDLANTMDRPSYETETDPWLDYVKNMPTYVTLRNYWQVGRPWMYKESWDVVLDEVSAVWGAFPKGLRDPRHVNFLSRVPSFDELYSTRGMEAYGWINGRTMVLTRESNWSTGQNTPIWGLWSMHRVKNMRLMTDRVDVDAIFERLAAAANEAERLNEMLTYRNDMKGIVQRDYFANKVLCEHLT